MKKILYSAILIFTLFLTGCADAGKDQTVNSGDTVSLDAVASTASVGGKIEQYTWKQVYGPKVEIENKEQSEITFISPTTKIKKRLIFLLKTVENGGRPNRFVSWDYVRIVINPIEEDNDTTPPVISINGEVNMTLEVEDQYTEEGASAIDDVDGEVNVTISGNVDTSVVGTNTITYTAIDIAGNSSTETRTITVVLGEDTLKPFITLNGDNTMTLTVGDTYIEEGATAFDGRDGDVNVTISGHVDTSVVGTNTITYTASDIAGNINTEIRIVNVIAEEIEPEEGYYLSTSEGNDSNPGTFEKPWKTLAMAAHTLRAGDTVYIREGTYHERLIPMHSGTEDEKITYTNYKDEVVKIVGTAETESHTNSDTNITTTKNLTVVQVRQSYLVIKGLTFYHDEIYECLGHGNCQRYMIMDILFDNAQHNEILDNKFISPYPLVTLDTEVYNREGAITVGNGADHTLIEGNEIRNMSFMGIILSKGVKFTKIMNNKIIDVYQDAIHYGGGRDVMSGTLIEGNVLAGSIKSDGVQFNAPDTVNRGVIVRNNIMYNNAENNIDLKGTKYIVIEGNTLYGGLGDNDGGTRPNNNTNGFNDRLGGHGAIGRGAGSASEDVIVRNNIMYDNNQATATYSGWKIYNNTMVNNTRDFNGPNSSYTWERKPAFPGLTAFQDYNGQRVMNNIIGDHSQGEVRGEGPSGHIDYNVYFNTYKETEFAYFRDNNDWEIVSFVQWKEIMQDDNHSMVADPLFVNVPSRPVGEASQFDFSLQSNSPAIDAGGFLTTTTADGTGTLIKVQDVRFFHDGYGITQGDLIQFKGQTQTARVLGIDYNTNTLTVDTAMNWKKDDSIALAYKGSAPDIGAIEFSGVGVIED